MRRERRTIFLGALIGLVLFPFSTLVTQAQTQRVQCLSTGTTYAPASNATAIPYFSSEQGFRSGFTQAFGR